MNTRTINYTDGLKQEFAEVRGYYTDKGIDVTSIRKLNYAGKFHIQTETHGWYATFRRDDTGQIISDVQTIN